MIRPLPTPAYRLHKRTGKAMVTLPDGPGRRRDVTLGEWNTPESREAYERTLNQWRAQGGHWTTAAPPDGLTIAELVERFYEHVQVYYRRPDGTQTNEVSEYKY